MILHVTDFILYLVISVILTLYFTKDINILPSRYFRFSTLKQGRIRPWLKHYLLRLKIFFFTKLLKTNFPILVNGKSN